MGHVRAAHLERLDSLFERHGDVTVIAGGDINVNGSRIAAYDGGNVTVRSLTGNVDAGTGAMKRRYPTDDSAGGERWNAICASPQANLLVIGEVTKGNGIVRFSPEPGK